MMRAYNGQRVRKMIPQMRFGEKEFETTETTTEAEDCKKYESLKGVVVT